MGDRTAIKGTGALFNTSRHYCYVTAKHVLKGLDFERAGIPLPHLASPIVRFQKTPAGAFTYAQQPTRTFRVFRMVWPKANELDIAAVIILDGDLIAELKQSWQILSREDILTVGQEPRRYWVTGYPNAAGVLLAEGLGIRMIRFHTVEKRDVPTRKLPTPERPGVDLFLEYPPSLPHPGGLSGCLIWAELPEVAKHGSVSPQGSIRVAGIQHTFYPSGFLRATRAKFLAALLDEVDSAR